MTGCRFRGHELARWLVPAELLGHRLAHRKLLHLAGDRRGEAVDHPDIARNLVVRDASLAERLDLVRTEGRAALRNDPGAELLAVFRVRHAEHLDILDLRMPVQELLDPARIHVLAAPDHHVLDAADDAAIALLVDRREVAGVHPARRIDGVARPLIVVPIAEHDRVAARAQLAGLAARNHL